MDIKSALEKIGLSSNEIKVYLYLVDHGQSKAGDIAKGTEIQRSSAYGAINSLVHKGLVAYAMIGKVKFFQATSPNRLVEYIREQEETIKDFLPELRKRHMVNKKTGQVRMFKGIKGVKSVFKDMLRTKENNFCFGDDGQFRKTMPVFCKQFVREKGANRIKTRVLTRRRDVSNSRGSMYKFVDKATESNVAVNIYGDKINIIVWTDEPEAIIIENADAARSFKAYFEFMWKSAKKA